MSSLGRTNHSPILDAFAGSHQPLTNPRCLRWVAPTTHRSSKPSLGRTNHSPIQYSMPSLGRTNHSPIFNAFAGSHQPLTNPRCLRWVTPTPHQSSMPSLGRTNHSPILDAFAGSHQPLTNPRCLRWVAPTTHQSSMPSLGRSPCRCRRDRCLRCVPAPGCRGSVSVSS